MLSSPSSTAGLPPLVVLHHILVRSPLPLPHALHGWNETEYVLWVGEHTEEEALTLIDGVLAHWEKVNSSGVESSPTDRDTSKEFIELAHAVLTDAMQQQ